MLITTYSEEKHYTAARIFHRTDLIRKRLVKVLIDSVIVEHRLLLFLSY